MSFREIFFEIGNKLDSSFDKNNTDIKADFKLNIYEVKILIQKLREEIRDLRNLLKDIEYKVNLKNSEKVFK